MTDQLSGEETGGLSAALRRLTASARQVARGDYDAARHLFQTAASESAAPDLRELAETMGLMSVKIEGREFQLEQTLEALRKKSADLEHNLTLRAESGFLFCGIIIQLCLYTFLLVSARQAGWQSPRVIWGLNLGLVLLPLVFAVTFAKRHRHSLATWGLTWRGGWRALWESLLASLPVALGLVALKLFLSGRPAAACYGHPVFELAGLPGDWWFYALLATGQEIVARGFLQTSIERILTVRYRSLAAIGMTSLLFAVVHLHYSPGFMLSTFAGGIFFGALYCRHRTLVGVSAAHFLLGHLVFDVLRLI